MAHRRVRAPHRTPPSIIHAATPRPSATPPPRGQVCSGSGARSGRRSPDQRHGGPLAGAVTPSLATLGDEDVRALVERLGRVAAGGDLPDQRAVGTRQISGMPWLRTTDAKGEMSPNDSMIAAVVQGEIEEVGPARQCPESTWLASTAGTHPGPGGRSSPAPDARPLRRHGTARPSGAGYQRGRLPLLGIRGHHYNRAAGLEPGGDIGRIRLVVSRPGQPAPDGPRASRRSRGPPAPAVRTLPGPAPRRRRPTGTPRRARDT